MSKWIWCSALVLGLGAGAAAVKCFWISRLQPVEVTTVELPKAPRPLTPEESTPAPTHSKTAPAPAIVVDLNEPIGTRPESVDVLPEIVPSLPAIGGVEESEAGAEQAPRPDVEIRRMPYADEPEFVNRVLQRWPQIIWEEMPDREQPAKQLLSWSDLVRALLQLERRDDRGAEESEEPPLLNPPTPSHYHPPHCPAGGYCPYPAANRHGLIR